MALLSRGGADPALSVGARTGGATVLVFGYPVGPCTSKAVVSGLAKSSV